MQNSLQNGGPSKEEDPDALTKASPAMNGKGKAPAESAQVMDTTDAASSVSHGIVEEPAAASAKADTPFTSISSTNPHEEPTSTDPKETTRIQFRYSGGRIVRRFQLTDTVRRIYEWLKAAPIDGHADFELISMGKNLIAMLDVPVSEAGLKQGTVMVEFVDE